MSGFDYGNARLRALKSKLLSQRDLDALAESGSLQGLIAAMTKTAYRKPIEAALTRTSGLDCVSESLHHDLLGGLARVREFYDGQAGQQVALVFRRYDIHNLKAILRGLNRNAAAAEILSTLIPVGDLGSAVLTELVQSPDPRAAIDTLAILESDFAEPFLKLRSAHPGASTVEMELALDHWYYQETLAILQNSHGEQNVLLSALQYEADLTNILTLLRFVHQPVERKLLQEWMSINEFASLLVGPGRLSFTTLDQAANQNTVEAALEVLSGTLYHTALRTGAEQYAKSALLSEIEKQLRRSQLRWLSGQIYKDPLGIGVLLGYLALKTNEINNIRWIANSINLGIKADAIREGLEYPP